MTVSLAQTSPPARSADWRAEVSARRSRGSQAPRPGSLAGLAHARRIHLGQFWTPAPVVELVWSLLHPAVALSDLSCKRSLLDTSCGTGALFGPADAEQFHLGGVDVDAQAVEALGHAAHAAGFTADLEIGSLADAQASGWDWAILNPAFSVPLSSPTLQPLPCTSFGRFGPNSSAVSHEYAVQHARHAARRVLAILPSSFAATLPMGDGAECLHAVLRLPRGSFRSENTEVDTSLVVYADARTPGVAIAYGDLDPQTAQAWGQALAASLACTTPPQRPRLRMSAHEEAPSITLPVTGDRTVRVARNGRYLTVRFACGLAQAKGLNALLRSTVTITDTHRYPTARKRFANGPRAWYAGQGALDIELHLMQADVCASVEATVLAPLRAVGLEPNVDPGLWPYLRRRARRHAIETTPLRRFVKGPDLSGGVLATAKATHLLRPLDWRSPRIEAGTQLTFVPSQDAPGQYMATLPSGQPYPCTDRELHQRFRVENAEDAWRCVYPGRNEAFPERAAVLRRRAAALKIDTFCSWGYQLDDLIEHAMSRGDICGWTVGLGKARLAIALCLIGGGQRNLIAVPPHLVEEMVTELEQAPIAPDAWQVIRSPADLDDLRQINVISYARLRRPLITGAPRHTYARALRRRIHTLVADEATCLSDTTTQQTAALWQIAPARRYALTGTLIDYPRDALEVVRFVSGDGTARNPYGRHAPYLEPRLLTSMDFAERGIAAFADRFVSTEWVTNEFAEDLTTGAKRETPRLKSPEAYRRWLAPVFKRRVATEPEVTKFIRTPTYSTSIKSVPWDTEHWTTYLKAADTFAAWYRQSKAAANLRGVQLNLITLLARIQAVVTAADAPHRGVGEQAPLPGLTSKQRAAIAQIRTWVKEGRKSVVFATQPDVLDRLSDELGALGIASVRYHGGIPIAQRTRALNREFRRGAAPVLLASIGASQAGLNLPQASRALFLSYDWTASATAQCLGRLLRPQQTEHVKAVFLELKGSINVYQRQMTEFKKDAAAVGLDDQESQLDDVDFLHLDTLLGQFVEAVEASNAPAMIEATRKAGRVIRAVSRSAQHEAA
jgi:hypothetical protein